MIRFLLSFLLVSTIASCNPSEKIPYRLSVQQTIVLPTVAGASGIVLHKGNIIVISDNVPGYELIDTSTFTHIFFPFKPGATDKPQPKNIKEDFENASIVPINQKNNLVAFGSGSIEGIREHVLYFPVDSINKATLLPISWLYGSIRHDLGIGTGQLNIEASFSSADSFYLLNRGTNHLIAMSLPSLEGLITYKVYRPPAMNTRYYTLPVVDSFPVAFSGACFYKNNRFIFTASVEKTTNWIADGEIGGSWVGMATTDGNISFILPLKDEKGNLIKEKLESVDIISEYPNGDILLFAVADNDNGQSTLFKLLLRKL